MFIRDWGLSANFWKIVQKIILRRTEKGIENSDEENQWSLETQKTVNGHLVLEKTSSSETLKLFQ